MGVFKEHHSGCGSGCCAKKGSQGAAAAANFTLREAASFFKQAAFHLAQLAE